MCASVSEVTLGWAMNQTTLIKLVQHQESQYDQADHQVGKCKELNTPISWCPSMCLTIALMVSSQSGLSLGWIWASSGTMSSSSRWRPDLRPLQSTHRVPLMSFIYTYSFSLFAVFYGLWKSFLLQAKLLRACNSCNNHMTYYRKLIKVAHYLDVDCGSTFLRTLLQRSISLIEEFDIQWASQKCA